MDLTSFSTNFHFLRPFWLLALLLLALLLIVFWRRRSASRSWQRVVDARLLPHLLIGSNVKQGGWMPVVLGLGGMLAIVALAGPAWRRLEQPVMQQQSSLVVVLDLSRSMDATDLKPSRLQRAQLKLRDLLAQQKEGDTALVVYAATPFVVTPLTSDANTIASQIDSLTTDLMPAQGARPDLAIKLAQDLLSQAGAVHGGVLLICDGPGDASAGDLSEAITRLTGAGHKLSILGVGTAEGSPVPARDGGFLKNSSGAILLPRMDDAALSALAQQGNGVYRHIRTDDSDFMAALTPFKNLMEQRNGKEVQGLHADQWHDEGPWLLLPLLPLAALCFRRGYLLLLLLFLLPQARPVYAADWNSLWQNDDQRAQKAMTAQQPQQAAQLFHDPAWRAAAHYRSGDYQAALEDLKGVDSAEADYNRGNALAKLGRFPEAIASYEQALKRNPKLDDAAYNRDLLKKMNKQSPQSQQGEQNQQNASRSEKGKENNEGGKSNAKPEDKQAKSGQQKNGKDGKDSKPQSEQSSEQQPNPQQANQSQGQQQKQAQNRIMPNKDTQQNAAPDQVKNGPDKQNSDQQKNGKQPLTAEAEHSDKKLQPADEQWLRRIPDDPGGLWRRKFLYQYNKQQQLQGGAK